MSDSWRPPSIDDEFLTVNEVAAILNLHHQTVRNWIDAGRLLAVRIGRRVRVIRRDLDELIESNQTFSGGESADSAATDFWGG